MIDVSQPLPGEESSERELEPPTRVLPAVQLREIIASLPLPQETTTAMPVTGHPPTRVLPAGQLYEITASRSLAQEATATPTGQPYDINAVRPLPALPKVKHLGPAPDPFPRVVENRQPVPVRTLRQAKDIAMRYMIAHGYPDARSGPSGPDGGVDVVSRQAIAQVKHDSQPVGAPDITRLAGTAMLRAHRGKGALFFSSGGFTIQAVAAARELGVELYFLHGGSHWRRVR